MIQRKGFPFLAAAAAALGLCLLALPGAAAAGFADGAALCLHRVLPALFPFMVVCGLLAAAPGSTALGLPLKPLCRLCGLKAPDVPLALLLSWAGGYAVCAQTAADGLRRGRFSPREGMLLVLLGCCSGPGFVVGMVGGLLGSPTAGALLYGLQLAANFLAAGCLWPFCRARFSPAAVAPNAAETRGMAASGALPRAIAGAVQSSLNVCGCVVFFRVVSSVLLACLPAQWAAMRPVLSGLLEVSAGCADWAAAGPWAVWGIAACLSVPGFSVFAQLHLLLDGTLPLWPLAAARALHLGWFLLLLRFCLPLWPQSASVFRSLAPRVVCQSRAAPDAVLAVFCFLCAALYNAGQKIYNDTQCSAQNSARLQK